tara:strand:+ start:84 stop:524 length:441 start_codon:yes stop_codon:yes gene_type:complete
MEVKDAGIILWRDNCWFVQRAHADNHLHMIKLNNVIFCVLYARSGNRVYHSIDGTALAETLDKCEQANTRQGGNTREEVGAGSSGADMVHREKPPSEIGKSSKEVEDYVYRYDYIIFNFPHYGGRTKIQVNSKFSPAYATESTFNE